MGTRLDHTGSWAAVPEAWRTTADVVALQFRSERNATTASAAASHACRMGPMKGTKLRTSGAWAGRASMETQVGTLCMDREMDLNEHLRNLTLDLRF